MSLEMNVRRELKRIENVPRGATIYLFGSACYLKNPEDVDILVVYDPSLIPPEKAYSCIRPISVAAERVTNRNIHLTVLTNKEAADTGIIDAVEAIELHGT